MQRAIHATLAWHGHKVEGGGNEWFAVAPETVIEVARMIMASRRERAFHRNPALAKELALDGPVCSVTLPVDEVLQEAVYFS